MSELIDRSELGALLKDGCDWTVDYCGGGRSISGSGPNLPAGIIDHVPTRAKLRKLREHGSSVPSRTFFVARLSVDSAGRRQIHLTEGALRS